ncbi:tetratricopeptide repeat protein [Streptomyces sp. TRM 70351]|uniref:serine/threonine-protein kinase n=1 Tax=Streptomyces sp. TRM 70351 TaxID=3116552 RepID=UPI002E7BF9E4|nr:tetratricopeptide repeat protein [Streptomyces sp. TRM 70351]MEE1928353.1 tetratricopeptide repeat protein [Streptomyces sp. TRM 70351]
MTAGPRRACRQPGCAGAYEDVGGGELYCDVCGLSPVLAATGPSGGPGASGGSGAVPSARSGGARPSGRSRSSRRSVPGRLTGAPGTGPAARPLSVRSSGSAASSSTRNRLGAGLVAVPEVPRADPATAVLKRAEVPERKRFCGNPDCGSPVGRARAGRPGRTEGFCTTCGQPYSFVPKLRAGDVVHGQYEVAGCLAHGGLGWVYLAVDRAVSDRWVVLKGLLDTGDPDAMAAAISERRFLAEIEHASIVRIYNFVEHLDQRTGSLDGYIVMEYVGGKSLKQLVEERRTPDGRRDPLPVEVACAFGIEALEAIGHLHGRRLLYCDFKVDNAIQQHDQLKLIDLGAVRRMDDRTSAVYGTPGYQAPEVAELGPSVASDLYTVARTLAVLTFDFRGYTNVYADCLPDPDTVEVFGRHESFYRLLVRATDPDPRRRFGSAPEMAEQLTGVLREIAAVGSGRPRPAVSTLFGPELRVADTGLLPAEDGDATLPGTRAVRRGRRAEPVAAGPVAPAWSVAVTPLDGAAAALALPVPRVDPDDANAGFLAGLTGASARDLLLALRAAPADSVELRLRALRARLELARPAAWEEPPELRALTERHPEDWRVIWYRGVTALVHGDHETAALAFDAVYDAFPGEPAPKLALAVGAELLGQLDNAEEYYRLVWSTDPNYVGAAFGLARVRLARGDRAGAVAALESVPESSVHHVAARVASVSARLRQRGAGEPLLADLRVAAAELERLRTLGLDARRGERLAVEVLGRALDWVLAGRPGAPEGAGRSGALLGSPPTEDGLRRGLETACRRLARLAPDGTERNAWVERANRYRPRTWV